MYHTPLEIKVWGSMACWTRPEMKVERVTYEVMTPSAACGILQAIFWKPEIRWQVREIRVLRPIRHISLLRNEVKSRAVSTTAERWSEHGGGYYADEDRTQRHTLALRDVSYIIAADIVLQPGVHVDAAKYRDQFRRRVRQGQCHSMPCLGCREFTASFESPDGTEQPQDIDADLGLMLFNLDYQPDVTGRGKPHFFHAYLEGGILRIPEHLYTTQGVEG